MRHGLSFVFGAVACQLGVADEYLNNDESPLNEDTQSGDMGSVDSESNDTPPSSTVQSALIVVCVLLFVVGLVIFVVSTALTLISGSRHRRGLTFGPPLHRPPTPYLAEPSWAERVLQALRDRRDGVAEKCDDAPNSAPFLCITDPPLFDYSTR